MVAKNTAIHPLPKGSGLLADDGKNIIKYGKLQQSGIGCDGDDASTQSNEQVLSMNSEALSFRAG